MGLDIRTRELIAVGASVAANCQACLQYHFDKTRENGVEPPGTWELTAVSRRGH
jgi:AhpD family alkylhydroperoxidase